MKSDLTFQLPPAPGPLRLKTAGVADPTITPPTTPPGPTDLLLELGESTDSAVPQRRFRILASGTPAEINAHSAAAGATTLDLTHAVLMPGMVNAHTHLDLTHLGPLPHDPDAGFVAWVDRVREGRAQTPEEIQASVRRGIDLSLRAGVVLVGDIAGAAMGVSRLEPYQALAESPLAGVSFLEFFAIGSREAAALERLDATLAQAQQHGLLAQDQPAHARLGLQPHAPNTVSLLAYQHAVTLAARYGLPLATHLAETPEEHEFIAHGTGPQRDMLERFGLWTEGILDHIAAGKSPIEHLAPVLDASPFVVAHCNDLGDPPAHSLDILRRARASVAYCPRASIYFNAAAHFGPHRYRDMLAAGINVCLGTDSILNLPDNTDTPDGPGMSVLDEARLLFDRDGTDAHTLLRMATTHGCLALGWPEAACALTPDATPLGLVAVDVADTPPDRPAAERALLAPTNAQLLLHQPA